MHCPLASMQHGMSEAPMGAQHVCGAVLFTGDKPFFMLAYSSV